MITSLLIVFLHKTQPATQCRYHFHASKVKIFDFDMYVMSSAGRTAPPVAVLPDAEATVAAVATVELDFRHFLLGFLLLRGNRTTDSGYHAQGIVITDQQLKL